MEIDALLLCTTFLLASNFFPIIPIHKFHFQFLPITAKSTDFFPITYNSARVINDLKMLEIVTDPNKVGNIQSLLRNSVLNNNRIESVADLEKIVSISLLPFLIQRWPFVTFISNISCPFFM